MDSQKILAVSLAMEKIEKRHPQDFRENSKWKSLYMLREKYCKQMAEEQLAYHTDRYRRTKDLFSAIKIRQYTNYLEKFKEKEM